MKTIIKSNNIEEILSSFDGIKRAEAPVFFFQRIQAKLATEITPYIRKTKRTSPKTAFAITIVPFIILLDYAAFKLQEKREISTAAYNDSGFSPENDLGDTIFYAEPEIADAFDLEYY